CSCRRPSHSARSLTIEACASPAESQRRSDPLRATMSPFLIGDVAARASRLGCRWRASTEGVAAVEFALIVPIMAIMFIGAVELSQAITVDRRVTQVASSTADLVARAETQISQAEITDIMKA